MDRTINEIGSEQWVKFTVNLPVSTFAKLAKKAYARFHNKNSKSYCVREALDRYLVDERPVTMAELLRIEKEGEVYGYNRKYEDPPKKYSGFKDSLCRSLGYLIWWRKKNLDKYSPKC